MAVFSKADELCGAPIINRMDIRFFQPPEIRLQRQQVLFYLGKSDFTGSARFGRKAAKRGGPRTQKAGRSVICFVECSVTRDAHRNRNRNREGKSHRDRLACQIVSKGIDQKGGEGGSVMDAEPRTKNEESTITGEGVPQIPALWSQFVLLIWNAHLLSSRYMASDGEKSGRDNPKRLVDGNVGCSQ